MSDEHPPNGPGTAATGKPVPDGHLDLEAASAAVDGEGTDAERAHLTRCSTCRTDVDRLDRVRSSIGASTRPVPPSVREAAISAALEVFDEPERSRAAPVVPPPRGAPGAAPPDVRTLRTRQRSRPRFDAGPLLGVAAIVVLVALAIPLLSGLGGGGDDDDSAASMDDTASDAAEGGEAEEESSALDTPADGPVDVGDLGEVDAAGDLGAVVTRALPDRIRDPSRTAADPEDRAAEDGSSGGTDEDTTTSPAPGAPGASEGEGAPDPGATDCVDPVRAELVEAGELLFSGTARVDGAPAFVLGFDVTSDDGTTVLAVIVAAADCDIVTTQSHVPG